MKEQELYQKVHDQVLDYADDETIFPCALWGYSVHKKLTKHTLILMTAEAEQSEEFIYAVVTAVIIGEFARCAYGDFFNDEVSIDLDLLDMDFKRDGIKYFIDEGVLPNRLELLEEVNGVGLQDMWATICEYKKETHRSLEIIYNKEGGSGDFTETIFNSLDKLFQPIDDEGTMLSSMIDARRLDAYSYISNGFQI